MRWWFRRSWGFRQTNGQVVCIAAVMPVVFGFLLMADDYAFRFVVASIFAFKVANEVEGLVKTEEEDET
jgi:hypothetical protein